MKESNSKEFTLRAYKIVHKDISTTHSDIIEKFSEAIALKTNAIDRVMTLNRRDSNSECDILSFHLPPKAGLIKGLIIRTMQASDSKNVSDDVLSRPGFKLSDLESIDGATNSIMKESYYFCMNHSYVVTNLSYPIKRFQTYINWLLEDVRGDKLYEFTPLLAQKEIKFSDIKFIQVKDNDIYMKSLDEGTKQIDLGTENLLVRLGLNDVPAIHELRENNILTAKVIIGFKKPRKMVEADYENMLSASLKPLEDSDDIEFVHKKGQRFKGSNLLVVKTVVISLTESEMIVEEELLQELECFIKEI